MGPAGRNPRRSPAAEPTAGPDAPLGSDTSGTLRRLPVHPSSCHAYQASLEGRPHAARHRPAFRAEPTAGLLQRAECAWAPKMRGRLPLRVPPRADGWRRQRRGWTIAAAGTRGMSRGIAEWSTRWRLSSSRRRVKRWPSSFWSTRRSPSTCASRQATRNNWRTWPRSGNASRRTPCPSASSRPLRAGSSRGGQCRCLGRGKKGAGLGALGIAGPRGCLGSQNHGRPGRMGLHGPYAGADGPGGQKARRAEPTAGRACPAGGWLPSELSAGRSSDGSSRASRSRSGVSA